MCYFACKIKRCAKLRNNISCNCQYQWCKVIGEKALNFEIKRALQTNKLIMRWANLLGTVGPGGGSAKWDSGGGLKIGWKTCETASKSAENRANTDNSAIFGFSARFTDLRPSGTFADGGGGVKQPFFCGRPLWTAHKGSYVYANHKKMSFHIQPHEQGHRYHLFQVFGGTGPPILEGHQIWQKFYILLHDNFLTLQPVTKVNYSSL
jgi:hypothetical protein